MKKLYAVICTVFITRIIVCFLYFDFNTDYYWEYGEIAKNLVHGNGYSLFYYEGDKLEHEFTENSNPQTTAYMPPGYVAFLTPFMLIDNLVVRNSLIILIHIILSCFTVYFIYRMSSYLFNELVAVIASLAFALIPEFIYSVISFTPTVIFHFCMAVILYLLSTGKYKKGKNIYLVGAIFALLIYFRSEAGLFAALVAGVWMLYKRYNFSLKIVAICFLAILPWSIRNTIELNKVIPLSTSFGLNFYRGNNPYGIGVWGDENIDKEIKERSANSNIELSMNDVYTEKAKEYLSGSPMKAVLSIPVKIFDFFIVDLADSRAFSIVYLLPHLFLLCFFVYGVIVTYDWARFKYFYLFFLYFTIVIVVFFPMIRYQTMMKIGTLPFFGYGFSCFWAKMKGRFVVNKIEK